MEGKRFLIEFIGGDWDGKTLDSHSRDEIERMHVKQCLFMTDNGTIGKAWHGISMETSSRLAKRAIPTSDLKRPEGGKTHKYTVVERLDEDDDVLVRVEYSVRNPSQDKKTK